MAANTAKEHLPQHNPDQILDLSEKLDLHSFSDFLKPENNLLALRVSNYFPKDLCTQFNERLLTQKNELFRGYSNVPKSSLITKIGVSFAEACIVSDLMDSYFQQAPKVDAFLREFFFPYVSPIDKVRLDLDTIWPHGAVVGQMYGQKMRSGFIRNTPINSDIVLHQDDLIEETPGDLDFYPKVEIVNNVYLSVPPPNKGGELEVYDYAPNYADQVNEIYDPEKESFEYLLPKSAIESLNSQSSVIIKPAIGDLILFKGKCVHRVHTVKSGNRLTSCFHIAYVDENEPLRCWI